jgi:hypothetical protein
MLCSFEIVGELSVLVASFNEVKLDGTEKIISDIEKHRNVFTCLLVVRRGYDFI